MEKSNVFEKRVLFLNKRQYFLACTIILGIKLVGRDHIKFVYHTLITV